MTSWTVREGTGGIKPLTDRDRREIVSTARKVLGARPVSRGDVRRRPVQAGRE